MILELKHFLARDSVFWTCGVLAFMWHFLSPFEYLSTIVINTLFILIMLISVLCHLSIKKAKEKREAQNATPA